MKKYNKGFTLIELLVVIAIIGILAGVILVSLNTARLKAKDAVLKTAAADFKAFAEIIYSDDQLYTDACSGSDINSGEEGGTALQASIDQNLPTTGSVVCSAGPDSYSIFMTTNSPTDGSKSICATQDTAPTVVDTSAGCP